ncbi:MAG: hypothetical protein B6D61_14765 [Bacteroidetes bacterium 4484_249]|nr:MAG: hypothetical protein B6D61_14765 [Bacteroidetes bacterium 4484_249]OYT12603.1 MAG: hypothetical protein B6I19_09520 [Bacteroidetes bacterium 4572_114]
MKTLIKVIFVFAALFFIANINALQAQESLTSLTITNPACCPAQGFCGADHPVLGPANSQNFNGNGIFNVFIGWDQALPPGTAIVFYWARTYTVEVPNAAYVEMYCYGDDYEEIGYNFNLSASVTTSPVYIYEEENPD